MNSNSQIWTVLESMDGSVYGATAFHNGDQAIAYAESRMQEISDENEMDGPWRKDVISDAYATWTDQYDQIVLTIIGDVELRLTPGG